MNCLYTIPLCNFGFAFRHATCVIVKDFGKALLKNQNPPRFSFHTNYPNGNCYLKLPNVFHSPLSLIGTRTFLHQDTASTIYDTGIPLVILAALYKLFTVLISSTKVLK